METIPPPARPKIQTAPCSLFPLRWSGIRERRRSVTTESCCLNRALADFALKWFYDERGAASDSVRAGTTTKKCSQKFSSEIKESKRILTRRRKRRFIPFYKAPGERSVGPTSLIRIEISQQFSDGSPRNVKTFISTVVQLLMSPGLFYEISWQRSNGSPWNLLQILMCSFLMHFRQVRLLTFRFFRYFLISATVRGNRNTELLYNHVVIPKHVVALQHNTSPGKSMTLNRDVHP